MSQTCIIVPCYNEASRLAVAEFIAFAKQHDFHFLFVNDGSKDTTAGILDQMQSSLSEKIQVVHLAKNGGKAEAVRQGFLHALQHYTWIGYLDADLATPLQELNHMMALIHEKPQYRAIFGSRIKRMGASIHRNPARHYIGRVFATVAGTMLKLPIYDTQCGAKLLHKDILTGIFDAPFASAWLFDVELLGRIRNKLGILTTLQLVVELPLENWKEIEGSKLKATHFLKLPFELWKVHKAIN